jgi:hypothetical protein
LSNKNKKERKKEEMNERIRHRKTSALPAKCGCAVCGRCSSCVALTRIDEGHINDEVVLFGLMMMIIRILSKHLLLNLSLLTLSIDNNLQDEVSRADVPVLPVNAIKEEPASHESCALGDQTMTITQKFSVDIVPVIIFLRHLNLS